MSRECTAVVRIPEAGDGEMTELSAQEARKITRTQE